MANHSELRLQATGTGPVIVMLHGYLSSGQYFKHIRRRFPEHTVITLDLLGFGRSPKPKLNYTYDDHINAIHKTLENFGIKAPFVLLGHSMGGLIALKYALRYPDDISRLLLFNAPLFTSREQMVNSHMTAERRYRMMLYSRRRHLYWRMLRLLPRRTSPRRTAINFSDTLAMSHHAREGSYHNVIGGADVFGDLTRVVMPTLLVTGKYDRAIYAANLVGRTLPKLVTSRILDVDHHPLVRAVDDSENLIRSHLIQ